jgi:hypothetical protein
LSAHERDLVAHAVNELIKELPPRRMPPYSQNGTKQGKYVKPHRRTTFCKKPGYMFSPSAET